MTDINTTSKISRRLRTTPGVIIGGLSLLLLGGNAFAGFVTSSVGTGAATDLTASQPLNAIFPDGDSSAPTFTTTMNDLYNCLSNQQTCTTNAKTAALDTNNDGELSDAEILATFTAMSCLTSVPSANKYARAIVTEVKQLSDLSDCDAVQTAITTASTYVVDAPSIDDMSDVSLAQYGTTNAQMTITDGAGNAHNTADYSVSSTVTLTDSNSMTVTQNWFELGSNGMLQLTSGTSIEDVTPGTYTVDVSVTDTNTNSYGLSGTQQFGLTVSNQRGCIINNGIASANFDTNGDNSAISGAKVTISGSHNTNDLLFVRTATKSGSGNTVTYTNVGTSGITGTYNKTSGQLEFTGSTTIDNWISIFRKVGYIYDDSGAAASTTRSLIFSLSTNVVFNHSDGKSHFYKFKDESENGIDFDDALVAAGNSTLFGLQGYLATITSAAEQQYIQPKLGGIGWIGGCDRLGDSTIQSNCGISASDLTNLQGKAKTAWTTTTGHHATGDGESYFYWVTGPERLEFIGEDTRNCSSSNYAERKQETLPISSDSSLTDPAVSIVTTGSNYPYHNFQGCEPNNYRHDSNGENYMHVYASGAWNDYRVDDSNIAGYLIEYGGMSGDPDVDLTEDKSYNVATEGQFCVHQS